jgi:hypothetical protein
MGDDGTQHLRECTPRDIQYAVFSPFYRKTVTNSFEKVLRRLKRTVFLISMPVRSVQLPATGARSDLRVQLAVVISSIYWTLLLVFPSLIIAKDPRVAEPSVSGEAPPEIRLPLKHDLALHAVPGLSLLLDFILFEQPYTGKIVTLGAPLVCLAYAVGYGSWVEYCATFNGTCE